LQEIIEIKRFGAIKEILAVISMHIAVCLGHNRQKEKTELK